MGRNPDPGVRYLSSWDDFVDSVRFLFSPSVGEALLIADQEDGSTDAYSAYHAGDNLQTLTQTFTGGQNNVTFTYGWLKNHQRQSTAVNSSFCADCGYTESAEHLLEQNIDGGRSSAQMIFLPKSAGNR
jgi:hypothetical protein